MPRSMAVFRYMYICYTQACVIMCHVTNFYMAHKDDHKTQHECCATDLVCVWGIMLSTGDN